MNPVRCQEAVEKRCGFLRCNHYGRHEPMADMPGHSHDCTRPTKCAWKDRDVICVEVPPAKTKNDYNEAARKRRRG